MITPPEHGRNHGGDGSPGVAPDHLADLRRSGLTDDTIRAAGLYTERDARQVRTLLNWSGQPPVFLGPCLVFPYVHPDGRRNGYVRIKPSKPRADKKPGKPIKYEAPKGSGNRLYIPPGTVAKLADPDVPLLLTEGEKKALAADQAGYACLSVPGVWSWQKGRPRTNGKPVGPRRMIPDFDLIPWTGRAVTIGFDSDAADNPDIQWAEWHLAKALGKRGATVTVVRLPGLPPEPDGKPNKVGLDDFLRVNGVEALTALLHDAQPPAKPKRDRPADGRPTIIVSTEEHETNDAAVTALAADADLYQRGGLLVRVTDQGQSESRAIRRPAGPRIEPLLPPSLRERLTRAARWVTIKAPADGSVERPAHPPAWCVSAVHARGRWAGVRPLEAIIEYPVLRPDGAILLAPGYDAVTGLIYAPSGPVNPVPDRPAAADVRAAVAALEEAVCDFPFEADAHKAAWVAGLLTPLGRFAFAGPAPLFLADANVRAAGKTLLMEAIGYTVTGRPMTVSTYTRDQDELRKRITALAVEGDQLVLLDNLSGMVRNPVLDAALTAETWKDRILGVNRTVAAPLLMTWYASGNNALLDSDTARRTCRIRLKSPEERPELRSGFRHPDLIGWVRQERPRLLAAALTLLRGYGAAGRPDQRLTAWGSYAGWSDLIRSAVVWAGLADPGETRVTVADGDPTAEALGVLLTAWQRADPDRRGLTAGDFLKRVQEPHESGPEWAADARAALDVLLDRLDARALGTRLRTYRRRVVGGLFFDRAGERQNAVRWAVYAAHEFRTRPKDTHGTHDTHASAGQSSECGECRVCDSATGRSGDTGLDVDADGRGDAWEGPAPPADTLYAGDGPYRARL
jgi:hypothetical protein